MEKWLQDNILKIAIIISLPLLIAYIFADDKIDTLAIAIKKPNQRQPLIFL